MKETSKAWREIGDYFAQDPGQWVWQAGPFLRASETCWERYSTALQSFGPSNLDPDLAVDIGLVTIAYYLLAVATELLVKAEILQKNPQAASSDKAFYTHDLILLSQQANLSLTPTEKTVLRKLTRLLDWAARYPVPNWSDEKGRKKFDVQVEWRDGQQFMDTNQLPSNLHPEDWDCAHQFVGNLLKILRPDP